MANPEKGRKQFSRRVASNGNHLVMRNMLHHSTSLGLYYRKHWDEILDFCQSIWIPPELKEGCKTSKSYWIAVGVKYKNTIFCLQKSTYSQFIPSFHGEQHCGCWKMEQTVELIQCFNCQITVGLEINYFGNEITTVFFVFKLLYEH